MRQAVMAAPGQIEFKDVQIPAAGRGQVQIRVQRIGVCGSDIHVFHGKHPFVSYPLIQGHEFSGVIEAVGDGVEGVAVGEKVTATPQEVCDKCPPCKRGQYNACEELKVRGFQAPGCGQDFFVTEVEKLVKLPADFTFEQGAFVEPVAVAAHSTGRIGDLTGKNVVVSGTGDSFTAVLAAGLLLNYDLDKINDLANKTAAYVCSQPGAMPKMSIAIE